MSLADPEGFIKTMNRLDASMGHFNKVVAGLTRVIDKNIRAQTKVVAAANKTKGVMLGVVADLELMGGAFGKVKGFLANLLLPMDEDTPKIFRFTRAITSIGGMIDEIIAPIGRAISSSGERVRAINQEIAIQNEVAAIEREMAETNTRLSSALSLANLRMGDFFESLTEAPKELTYTGTEAIRELLPTGGVKGGVSWETMQQGKPPPSLMGLEPAPLAALGTKDKEDKEDKKKGSRLKKFGKSWKKNVTTPMKQIASGGIGLGFQVHIVMALMQAFAGLFAIFQPVMDLVGMLVERLSVGFMPVVMMLMDILTSPPVLAIVDQLADFLKEMFSAFEPLVPIIIMLIGLAIEPLSALLVELTPIMEIVAQTFGAIIMAAMPLIFTLIDVLIPIFPILAKVIGILILTGLYPLIFAIYGIGIVIAAIMDFFSPGANAVNEWNKLMTPILGAMSQGVMDIVMYDSYQSGTDYVPHTGLYLLHQGEGVSTPEENRDSKASPIVINMYGSYLGADMEDLSNRIAKKLSLHRF